VGIITEGDLLRRAETGTEHRRPGIWEIRSGRQQYTYSKIMSWVAFDRAIKGVEEFGLEGPVDHWRALRGQIHEDICSRAYDTEMGAFVQAYGSKNLDASLLLIPAVGFLPPDDPRVRSTISAIEKHLLADGFVRRYDTAETRDGLPPGEGSFLACSFWLADSLLTTGRRAEAQQLFERLLALRNDVGLLAEEYDPRTNRLIGNFPQALSHVALVTTAHNLTRSEKPVWQRSGHQITSNRSK
jgi:GH15 family glucan-1,4-alpha-glucosidase